MNTSINRIHRNILIILYFKGILLRNDLNTCYCNLINNKVINQEYVCIMYLFKWNLIYFSLLLTLVITKMCINYINSKNIKRRFRIDTFSYNKYKYK